MKKIILSIVSLLLVLQSGFAGPVTPDKAKQIAESFLTAQKPRTKASAPVNVDLVWRLPDIRTDADLLYVFNEATTGGYVIVSGEDAATPVLGFSESESFPSRNMPEAMRWLLDFYGSVIREARQRNLTATSSGEALIPTISSDWKRPNGRKAPNIGHTTSTARSSMGFSAPQAVSQRQSASS